MERAVLRPSYHPFQRRIGRMRDFFPKLPAPLSQIRKTKGLAGNKSKVGGYVSEELSLRGREESRGYPRDCQIRSRIVPLSSIFGDGRAGYDREYWKG